MLTKQQVFDKVVRHLLKQGVVSRRDGSSIAPCAYRGDGGTMCAVGCLIPDEAYDPSLEGAGANNPRVLAALAGVVDSEDSASTRLLLSLQTIHDCIRPADWRRELKSLAKGRGLRWPRCRPSDGFIA